MPPRLLTLPELSLLLYLLRARPGTEPFLAQLPTCRVTEQPAGGPGNLRFGNPRPGRRLGRILAEARFADEDGVPVLVRLYLDEAEDLYELDSWRVDSAAVRRIPLF